MAVPSVRAPSESAAEPSPRSRYALATSPQITRGPFVNQCPGRGHPVIRVIPTFRVPERMGVFGNSLGQNDCPIEHSQNSRISRSAHPAETRSPGVGPAAEPLEILRKIRRGHAEARLCGETAPAFPAPARLPAPALQRRPAPAPALQHRPAPAPAWPGSGPCTGSLSPEGGNFIQNG